MLDIILAAALIAAPKDADPSLLEIIGPTIITLAIDSELIDPRERTALPIDLEMLQNRNEEFKGYPRLGECSRFPDRKFCSDLLAMNRLYKNNLVQRLELDSIYEDIIRDAIIETDQLHQIWDTLRDAQGDVYYVTIRRQALKLLKDLIGDEAFYSGQMPPHIPVWHLPRGR